MPSSQGSAARQGAAARAAAASLRHVPALDGIRGLAILLVMFCHMTLNMGDPTWVDSVVRSVSRVGWIGVDLFFVLSGFLITGILFDMKGGRHYFRNFYMRRCLRILPLYYGFLLLLLAGTLLALPAGSYLRAESSRFFALQGWYWTHLMNVQAALGHPRPFNTGHFWSLAVEEQFYLVWPMVVFLCSRRGLMRVGLACLASSLVLRSALVLFTDPPDAVFILTPCRMDALAVGALIALSVRSPRGPERLATWAPRLLAGAGATMLAILPWMGGAEAGNPIRSSIGYTVLALFFGALLACTLVARQGGLLSSMFENRGLRQLGTYSYALYVFHYPLMMFLKPGPFLDRIPRLGGSEMPSRIAYMAAVLGASFAAAWLSWHLCEKHFLKLKTRFPARVPERPGTPGAG